MSGVNLRTVEEASASLARAEPSFRIQTHERPGRPRGLMLCALFTLAYRALRCFDEAGIDVHALGNRASHGLRFSRRCASFTETDHLIDGVADPALVAAINQIIARHQIDFVFAGDQPATRALIAMAADLDAPCYPMPDLPTFDLLNDKSRFTALCSTLGIRCPPTRIFPDRAAMLAAASDGTLKLPAVIKPLSLDGNRGVTIVATAAELHAARVDYSPILVQDFIPGDDIGASIYVERGVIRAYVCHRLRRARYTALDLPEVRTALTAIAAATVTSGILNFDMRLDPDGVVHFLECNPRVFYKMPLSMLIGVNFTRFGLAPRPITTDPVEPPPGAAVRSLKAILATLPTPWRLNRQDIASLRYILIDPIPYLRENLRIDWEDRSY
jgi:predicted ATP-grasp superfamily ATP-dependent carboligase